MLRVLDVETSSLRSVPCSRFAEPRDRAAQISLRLCWRTLGQRRRRPGSLYLRCARCSPSTGNDVVVKQGRVLTLRIDAPRERPVAQALQARMTKEGAASGAVSTPKPKPTRAPTQQRQSQLSPSRPPPPGHSQNDLAVMRRAPDIIVSASVADADTTLLSSRAPGVRRLLCRTLHAPLASALVDARDSDIGLLRARQIPGQQHGFGCVMATRL